MKYENPRIRLLRDTAGRVFFKFGSAEFVFHGYEIQDAGTKEGGDMSLSPHAAHALSDDDGAPVRELSHRGSHSGAGETPLERFACN